MKAEAIYTEVLKIESSLQSEGNGSALELLNALKESLKASIRDANNKQAGKGAAGKAALRILKGKTGHPVLEKAFSGDAGVMVCDGVRAVLFNAETAPELPQNESGVYYPYDGLLKNLNVAKNEANRQPVNIPSTAELKSYIAEKKAEAKAKGEKPAFIRYQLENGQHVNAQFLIDMLEALPGCAAYSCGGVRPLYFEAETGRGMLCVVVSR